MNEISKPINEFNYLEENIVINTSNLKTNEWANYLNFYNNNESKNNLEALSNIPIYSQVIVVDKKENYALLQLDGAFKKFSFASRKREIIKQKK